MSELITEIQRRRVETENTELVSKLPPENVREADLVLGVLFNGYENRLNRCYRSLSSNFCCNSFSIVEIDPNFLQHMARQTSRVHEGFSMLCACRRRHGHQNRRVRTRLNQESMLHEEVCFLLDASAV